jgi:LacI family transcriptional regulator
MTGKKNLPEADRPATLKMLAEYLDLSPATVSIVLNNSPVATSIPAYRPNLHARMLRSRLTNTIGIIAPELSEGYFTGVMLGVEQHLLQEGFLYFTVSHLGQSDLKDEYQELLMRRRVDGFLLVNTQLSLSISVPVVRHLFGQQGPSASLTSCSI